MDTNATVKATVAVPWLAIVSSTFKYIGIGLYYVTLPVVKLLLLLYYVLRYILSPFIALAQGLLQLVLIPWHVVAKFGVRRTLHRLHGQLTDLIADMVLHW